VCALFLWKVPAMQPAKDALFALTQIRLISALFFTLGALGLIGSAAHIRSSPIVIITRVAVPAFVGAVPGLVLAVLMGSSPTEVYYRLLFRAMIVIGALAGAFNGLYGAARPPGAAGDQPGHLATPVRVFLGLLTGLFLGWLVCFASGASFRNTLLLLGVSVPISMLGAAYWESSEIADDDAAIGIFEGIGISGIVGLADRSLDVLNRVIVTRAVPGLRQAEAVVTSGAIFAAAGALVAVAWKSIRGLLQDLAGQRLHARRTLAIFLNLALGISAALALILVAPRVGSALPILADIALIAAVALFAIWNALRLTDGSDYVHSPVFSPIHALVMVVLGVLLIGYYEGMTTIVDQIFPDSVVDPFMQAPGWLVVNATLLALPVTVIVGGFTRHSFVWTRQISSPFLLLSGVLLLLLGGAAWVLPIVSPFI
jgi:hypothetical protein